MPRTTTQTVIDALALPMPALLGTVNAYLIHGPKGAALVDCGLFDATSRKEFGAALEERGLRFEDIDTAFLTHQHVDHAGAARFFQERGAEIIMSKTDATQLAEYCDHPERDDARALFSGRHGLPDAFRRQVRDVFRFLRSMGQRVVPDKWASDGETIVLAGIPFEVLEVPGHTPGHLCLLSRALKVAFTGDCVISPRATYISASPEPDEGDPYRDFIQSLERLSTLTEVAPLSGHGAHQRPLQVSAPKIICQTFVTLTMR